MRRDEKFRRKGNTRLSGVYCSKEKEVKRACHFHLYLQNIKVKNDYDIYVHYEKGMPRSAVNLSTNQALAAAVASASHKNVHDSQNNRNRDNNVDVEGLEDMINQIAQEEGIDTTTEPKKPKSKKRLRAEATAASAELQVLASQGYTEFKPEANKFYRYIPIGRAYIDCLKIMKQRGALIPRSDDKLLGVFDDAVRQITEKSDLTLSVPDFHLSGSKSSSSKKLTMLEGTLISYNNYKDNWQLEVENANISRNNEILCELPRGKLFVKADDSRPSVRRTTGGTRRRGGHSR